MDHPTLTANSNRIEFPQLPGGAGVLQTLATMRALARDAAGDADFNAFEKSLVRGDLNLASRATGLVRFAFRKMKYANDPDEFEYIKDPLLVLAEILENGFSYGDCDDQATFLAALLTAEHIPNVVIALQADSPGVEADFNHVVNALPLVGGQFKVIDISIKSNYVSYDVLKSLSMPVYP